MQLDVRVQGKVGEITLDAFVSALDGLKDMLHSISRTISEARSSTVSLFVTDLRVGSLRATVDVRPAERARRADPARTTLTLVRGLDTLEHADELPEGFSQSTLSQAEALATKGVRGGVTSVELIVIDGSMALAPTTARVTAQLAENLQRARRGVHQELGGVYGSIDVVNARGQRPWFGLRDEVAGTAVRCYVKKATDLSNMILKRVHAHGMVHYNAADQPAYIDVEHIDILTPASQPVRVSDLLGAAPNLLKPGQTSVDYIRNMRDRG